MEPFEHAQGWTDSRLQQKYTAAIVGTPRELELQITRHIRLSRALHGPRRAEQFLHGR